MQTKPWGRWHCAHGAEPSSSEQGRHVRPQRARLVCAEEARDDADGALNSIACAPRLGQEAIVQPEATLKETASILSGIVDNWYHHCKLISPHPRSKPMIQAARITILVLSTLVLVGGILGFLRARSKASLIAGLVSSGLLDLGLWVSLTESRTGLMAADGVSLALFAIGAMRFRKTGKFMPGGFLMIISAASIIIVTLGLISS